MTRARGPPTRTVPVGTDADEQQDADACWPTPPRPPTRRRSPTPGCPGGRDRRAAVPAARGSLAHRLYNGEAGLDVVGKQQADLQGHRRRRAARACSSMIFRGFNFGIEFAGGNSFRCRASQSAAAARSARPPRTPAPRSPPRRWSAANTSCCAPASSTTTASAPSSRPQWPRPPGRSRSSQPASRSAPQWGSAVTDQALIAPGRLPGRGGHVPGPALPAEDGGRRDRRAAARPRRHRRRLLAGRLRGHPVDGHRLPDDPRLLALRHRRGLRQGRREHPGPRPGAPA